jgi:DNA polymerase-3 subunit delta'
MKFSNIIGHEELRASISNIGPNPQSYLFYGPPSSGKRTIANTLSKYILCNGTKGDGCRCSTCLNTDNPDYLSIGSNGKILVGDVDLLIDFVSRAPMCSPTKVIVVDNIDVITTEAANRLLKTIEESPFIFFFITSNIKKVLPTIRSRCLKIQFKALSQDDTVNILWKKMGFELPQARVIGWIGAGSSIDIFPSAGLYLKYRDFSFDLINLLNGKDLLSVLDFIDKAPRNDLPIFIDMLILSLTDMLLLKNNIDSIVNSDRRDDLQKMLKNHNEKALIASLNILTQVKVSSYLNINLNLALKSSLIKSWNIIKAPQT